LTFHFAVDENQVEGSSMPYVRELMYAANDAEEDASTPDT